MQRAFRHISAMAVVALVLWGCAKESYPGLVYDHVLSPDIINNESGKIGEEGIPVQVYLRPQGFVTVSSSGETRGTGPFIVPDSIVEPNRADSNRYERSVFYVLAFRDTLDWQGYPMTDFTKHSDGNDLDANCLIDAGERPHGLGAFLDPERTGHLFMKRADMRRDTTVYYSTRYKESGYNFFAYHVDDLPLTTLNRDATGCWYDVELDGTRDIMVGSAPLLTPLLLDSVYAEIAEHLSIDERRHILNIGNYSDYAARFDIQPYVDLKHILTRLRFLAFPADESCDSVYIESIEINCRNRGKLYVAAANKQEVGMRDVLPETDWVPLFDRNPTQNEDSIGIAPYVLPLIPDSNRVEWKPEYEGRLWTDNPPKVIGGDMLLVADSAYMMRVSYTQILRNFDKTTGENKRVQRTAVFPLSAPVVPMNFDRKRNKYYYQEGYVYNINIGIYGLRPIEVTVTVDGWQNGGEIDKTDEDP